MTFTKMTNFVTPPPLPSTKTNIDLLFKSNRICKHIENSQTTSTLFPCGRHVWSQIHHAVVRKDQNTPIPHHTVVREV